MEGVEVEDRRGHILSVGDPVTIIAPSDRPAYHQGSHGEIISIGTKRVHVRLTNAAFAHRDGSTERFLPEDLVYGHEGTPRHDDRMSELIAMPLVSTLRWGVETGVITEAQEEELLDLWVSRGGGRRPTNPDRVFE